MQGKRGLVMMQLVAIATGCAGPTTPIGAIWSLSVQDATKGQSSDATTAAATTAAVDDDLRSADSYANNYTNNYNRTPASLAPTSSSPKIQIRPSRQVLHRPSPMEVTIEDPTGIMPGYELAVRYNGFDVTESFLAQAKISERHGGKQIQITVPLVRLPPRTEHSIEFSYKNPLNQRTTANYYPPTCDVFASAQITNTEQFEPAADTLGYINRFSKEAAINPAMVAGLVAQESGFNPRAVSFSKAIGLTQVTPIAETEILDWFSGWPRYPGLNALPVPLLRQFVMTGKVNGANEWRLDSRRSIRGGLAFLQYLRERWTEQDNAALIASLAMETPGDPRVILTELVLASYNSGFSRVYGALKRHGKDWKKSKDLREARRYVRRISSFCHHFSEQEVNL